MTRQRQHEISVDGEPGWIRRANPLGRVAFRRGLPASNKGNTAVAAGYTARWSVSDGRLWLLAILDPDAEVWPAAMTRLFGDQHPPIPATWFSGRIVAELGDPIGMTHLGPTASTLEVALVIERSIVISSHRYEPGPGTVFARAAVMWSGPALLFGVPLVSALLKSC